MSEYDLQVRHIWEAPEEPGLGAAGEAEGEDRAVRQVDPGQPAVVCTELRPKYHQIVSNINKYHQM